MAIYRIYRKEWEKEGGHPRDSHAVHPKKRKNPDLDESASKEVGSWLKAQVPSGGRKGVSSGLSTVIKRKGVGDRQKKKWWEELGGDEVSKDSIKSGHK